MTSHRIKVHRRSVNLAGRRHTILSPRPDCPARFATNRYHQTWHVLSNERDARWLGLVFWAMAFQRRPHTFFLIDRPCLVPNPFDADPSSPIAVVNLDLGGLRPPELRALRRRLPLAGPPDGTVVLHPRPHDGPWRRERHCWITRDHGVVVLAACSADLRTWARDMFAFGRRHSHDSRSEVPLDYHMHDWGYDGEVQVFRDFRRRVRYAVNARRRLFPGRDGEQLTDVEREQVWRAAPSTAAASR